MKPRLREVPVLGRDGFLRLAYAEWCSPSAAQTIVCAHGVSRNGRDFDALAASLAAGGARVIAPDLPGRGRSDRLGSPAHAARFAVPIVLDIVLWNLWDAIGCPVLVLRGESSDLLSAATVDEMQRRGLAARAGRVRAVEIPRCGHAPALMDEAQIAVVREFLMARGSSTTDRRSPRLRPADRRFTGASTS